MPIDWDAIREALPFRKTPEEYAKRSELWSQIDINGNGYVSLAELDKGVRDAMQNEELFDCKPALIRAHTAAKDKVKTKSEHGADYVQRCEFRLVLWYLRQFFEYYEAFDRVDEDDDRRIDIDEFVNAKEMMEKWVGPIDDAEACFAEIDTNGGGKILFIEFCAWAIAKALDLEDDDDYDDQG